MNGPNGRADLLVAVRPDVLHEKVDEATVALKEREELHGPVRRLFMSGRCARQIVVEPRVLGADLECEIGRQGSPSEDRKEAPECVREPTAKSSHVSPIRVDRALSPRGREPRK